MQTPRAIVLLSYLFACALFTSNVQAGPLTYNVSANGADNPSGVFIGLSGQWNSGDLALPSGTTFGSTPLQIDINLSQNLTLNNPSGFELDGWGLAGLSPEIAPGGNGGYVQIELLEGTTVVVPLFSSLNDPLVNPFGFPISEYTTPSGALLPANAVFNRVEVLIGDANQESATDFEVSLNAEPAAVADTCNTLPLLFLGCVVVLGLGYRGTPAPCRQVSR
jgi:hypothetical protein